MEDRRKLKRRHLIYYLRVFEQGTNKLVGHLVDLTQEGIMLISENPIEVNKVYHLRMILPSRMGGNEEWLFDAESRWCNKDINPDFYDTGFKLLNPRTERA
jgi:hypothetical protein